MKQLVTAFFSYSRVERLGIAGMGIVFMLVIIIRCTLALWVHPAGADSAQQAKMAAAYNTWKLKEDSLKPAFSNAGTGQATIAGELFVFDPNTLDSAGFIRLGMPVKAIKGLLNWRRKGKHFYKSEDLKPLYNLPEETYARLAPYIRIAGREEDQSRKWSNNNSFPAIPAIINLNTADSALLDRVINGIGALLAHKIIARRTALGGFMKHEQLLEVYRFPDTTFQMMKEKLRIDISDVQKMNLNTATLARMSAHPYVGEKTAKNILLYKEGVGHYDRVEQLREVPLMNEEIYRKIAPYFVVD